MARYIDADALMEYVKKTDWYSILRGNMTVGAENSEKAWYKAADIYAAIEIAPTIEARPVVRGEWIDGRCSECGGEAFSTSWDEPIYDYDWEENLRYSHTERHVEYHETDFCPYCNADMRGEDNEAD